MLAPAAGQGSQVDLAASVEMWLERVCGHLGLGVQEPHRGERAAFVAYALAFPRGFQGLLDTYSVPSCQQQKCLSILKSDRPQPHTLLSTECSYQLSTAE